MNVFFARLLGPCLFGHSKDYVQRREATEPGAIGRLMKECPRCHAQYAPVLGGEMLKTGRARLQAQCAGVPTGKATPVEPLNPKVATGRFR